MENGFKRFCGILHVVANYMDSYCGDLFLDLPTAWDNFNNEESNYPIFCVRKTGADLIERFEDCLKEDGVENPSIDESVAYAQKSLGVDFLIEITPYKVIVTNYRVGKMKLEDLDCRLKDYTEVEIADKSLA